MASASVLLKGQSRWARSLRGVVLGSWLLLAGGVGARAQVAAGSRAQVVRVPTTGEASRFQVPQVRLPNALVAQRINRQLLRFSIAPEFTTVDSTASPRRN